VYFAAPLSAPWFSALSLAVAPPQQHCISFIPKYPVGNAHCRSLSQLACTTPQKKEWTLLREPLSSDCSKLFFWVEDAPESKKFTSMNHDNINGCGREPTLMCPSQLAAQHPKKEWFLLREQLLFDCFVSSLACSTPLWRAKQVALASC